MMLILGGSLNILQTNVFYAIVLPLDSKLMIELCYRQILRGTEIKN